MEMKPTRSTAYNPLPLLLFVAVATAGRRTKPFERLRPTRPDTDLPDYKCYFFEQPLNHFDLPRMKSGVYQQKYCINDDYVVDPLTATVFFYTGNESPVEQYINNTGLMWELAPDFNAQVVFVEHRYEGESVPAASISDCMAYASSVQALADYARFIEIVLFRDEVGAIAPRPVIAFGGSYGGMLTAWMRMKYPNLVTGGIAASAPIWGFPLNFPSKIDTAFRVITRAMEKNYPPTQPSEEKSLCAQNLLASYPLVRFLASEGPFGRGLISDAFRLCSPLEERDALRLISWAQTPWFDLAEGSFPYPSSYIPFALTHDADVKLPAWPLHAACGKYSDLQGDMGITITGDLEAVRYNISYGNSGLVLQIDWDTITVLQKPNAKESYSVASALLENVRNAVSVWYNMTEDQVCYELDPAPNSAKTSSVRRLQGHSVNDCKEEMQSGSWNGICCNEEMNLIITDAQGLGHDFKWPPSHKRGTATYADILESRGGDLSENVCPDPQGFFGYPKDPPDSWSTTYDIVYGGVNILSHSNIVFSNGLLDPWSAAGVYVDDPAKDLNSEAVPGLFVQNLNDRDLVALIMEFGGHHTDLMFSSDDDPLSIKKARLVEKHYIAKWIDEFWSQYRQAPAP